MVSIGVIVRADANVESLGQEWVPVPLGLRSAVESVFAEVMSGAAHLLLTANIEGLDESPNPRVIVVTGVWGEEERDVLGRLCSRLGARFYDPETGDFVSL
jgi:hypothetical protein